MPVEYTLAEFQKIIRQKMELPKEMALMCFVNKKLLKLGDFQFLILNIKCYIDSTIEQIYKENKDDDDILYITLTDIATYGL